jgi:hypothetical protein
MGQGPESDQKVMHHNVPMRLRVGEPRGTSEQDESSVNGLCGFHSTVKILELPGKMITRRSDVRLILDADVGNSGQTACATRDVF